MNTTTILNAADAEIAAQDAAAEASQAPAAAKPKPASKPRSRSRASAAPKRKQVLLDGKTYMVDAKLSDSDAQAAAVKLRDYNAARASGTADNPQTVPDVDRPADADKPKPKPRGMQLASGEVKVRLSKTAFEALGSALGKEWREANKSRWSKIKATKSSRFGSTVTFYFPVTQDEGKSLIAWLRSTAKKWDSLKPADRAGSPKPLVRNADLMAETISAWRKGQ